LEKIVVISKELQDKLDAMTPKHRRKVALLAAKKRGLVGTSPSKRKPKPISKDNQKP
jgi:hypothetical protein